VKTVRWRQLGPHRPTRFAR